MELKKYCRNILLFIIVSFVYAFGGTPSESRTTVRNYNAFTISGIQADTVRIDTTGVLPFNFKDEPAFAFPDKKDSAKLFLKRPSNIRTEIEYDPVSGEYIFTDKVGDLNFRLPKTMTRKEFQKYDFEQSVQNYWRNQTKIKAIEDQGGLIPRLTIGGETFSKIFGSNTIDIRPQGYVEVSFGYQMNATENPSIPERLRKVPTFDFDQKIQMNVMGKIGDRMEMRVNYNTEATFDYENKMNLGYTGDEDQIIKKIEAGNVSLPLNGSLITGGSNLFGVKTEMQFGKLNLTTIFSQHKGETQVIESEGGAQKKTFEIAASDYDANRHFFLAQYFRDSYNEALKTLPVIRSSITINKIEVWVTNKSSNFKEARNILAFMDLGEHDPNIYNKIGAFQENSGFQYPETVYPFNDANGIHEQMKTTYAGIRRSDNINKTLAPLAALRFNGGQDFEKIEQARLLSESEYTISPNLGYISLRSALNTDEILAVAFNYTANGKTYQVGEFSTDGINAPETLVLKLLKGTNLSPKLPTWKLMMKNIYDLNAYQLTKDEFVLDIMYQNDETGSYINYLPEGRLNGHILLNVLNLDKLNSQQDLMRDGVFDYVEGITVSSSSGKIIFPVLEPFGKHLADSIGDPALIRKYVYSTLYDSTRTVAEQDAEHDKFRLKGSYKGSSSSEIMAPSQNLARGSVKVTSGGRALTENIDYTVDYASGIVKIINSGLLESGAPIQVSTESQDLFSMQRKTMIGAHANYAISDRFNLGATVLHMQERPLTQKVNYGDDPISNTMLGFDAAYSNESLLLTKIIDKLPFYSTKAPSSISFDGEVAQLIPGHSKVIKKSGTAYIDDFEATKTSIDLKTRSAWALASTPQKQTMFPEAETNDELSYGFNRAKLAWYIIDPLFLRNSPTTPDHIKNDKELQSNHLVREVYESEIFPDRETPVGLPTNIPVFDLAFYPEERGPYNFETQPSRFSQGVNPDGTLRDPESRWGGIMRRIETSDFEAANIEFLEFWVMDPFVNDSMGTHQGGELYFNLGDISEDVLKDSRKSFENGLPTTPELTNVDSTLWGRVSTLQSLVKEFDNNIESRRYQDIGFDGMNDADENTFHQSYLETMKNILNQDALTNLFKDPAGDNYHYYRGSDYDDQKLGILERYKMFNGPEGNSPTAEMSPESYPTTASTQPDIEDINGDNTLNEYERYYQYKVNIRREDMVVGRNMIADIKEAPVKLKNGSTAVVKWYQFKVPVKNPSEVFGSINDFKSIRFMRMFMKGFSQPTVLRFATLDLVRSDWRKYTKDVDGKLGVNSPTTQFDISAVNIEENASRRPVNYVLPPGIERVIDPANPQLRQLNEQSLVMRAIELVPGDARAAYKNLSMDFRNYKRLQMEVHAEAIEGYSLKDNDLSLFVRIGSDYYNNYYEYEIPLSLTAPGQYKSEIEADRYDVWPDANRIDLTLEAFTNLKLKRNDELRQAGSNVSLTQEFIDAVGTRTIKIKGNPNLGNVEVMMVGIRNNYSDTKDPKGQAIEVWLNELRLSDFEEGGGWAATGRVSARLADLGSVIFAGRTRSAGFGSIEQKVNERAMEDLSEIDISANLELGKFFPEKAQVKIPLYVGYSESKSNPKYNPLDPDIKMKDALDLAGGKDERDSLKRLAQDLMVRKSINLTNVKIDRTSKSGKPKIYDPTNFSVTYSYNEMVKRSINIEENLDKNYRGMFSYNFNGRPEVFEPFKNSKVLNKKALRLIKDFNIYPLPSQFSFRTDLWRHYNETQLRNISNPNMIIPRTFNKDFIWNRYFDLRYNLSRSFQFDFSSENTARIDEPEGRINRNDDDYSIKKDSILTNLMNLGRPTLYHHILNATYMVPISKLPLLDWTSLSATYRGMYDWQAGPVTEKTIVLGNVVENSRQIQVNSTLNMITLYNKVGFLKEINQKYGTSSRQLQRQQRPRPGQGQAAQQKQPASDNKKGEPKIKEVQYSVDNVRLKANTPKSIFHKLKTEDVEVTAVAKDGTKIAGQIAIVNENRVSFTPEKSLAGVRFIVKGKVKTNGDLGQKIIDYTARALMSVRSVSVSYSANDGTVLPGFMPVPRTFGFGKYTPDEAMFGSSAGMSMAPGLPFLMGWQDKDFALRAAEKGWITRDTSLNSPFVMSHSETVTFRANVEPFPDLRIDVNANRTYSERTTEFYNYDSSTGSFDPVNKSVRGNFTMSVNTMKTAFSKMNKESVPASEAFQNLKDYRAVISQRLSNQRIANSQAEYTPGKVEGTEYYNGYGPTSPQVMVPAFIAAYTGQAPEKVALSPFPSIKYMRPNWRITYEGVVQQSPFLKKYLKTLSFNHSYRSSYNVGSFISNLDYDDKLYKDGFSYVRNTIGDFIGPNDINSVSISEQFSPLINMEITWINDFETRAELKSSRNLALSFSNNQLTEMISNEMVFGLGYRFTRMDLIIKTKKSQKAYSNDLNIRGDLSFRKNKTILRKIVEENDQLTAGQNAITLKTTADYMLSDRFQLRIYYDRILNKPLVGSFNTSNTNFGVSFRFTLAQ
ncbi:MAG: cell surface protein SprA [Bacteroidetes bacterium GWB2_41_8]|nr:MAG: cell surface protein SprA [Bacteroidetes bacterium GWB2_41_8]